MATDGETSKGVVVCGGGVIGVCTAYFLGKKGISVTLVEKSAIACAASGKAGGFLAFDWCDGSPVSSLARASFNLHKSLAEELNGAESYGYRALTTLSLTVTESKPNSGGLGLPAWVDGPAKSPSTIGTTETTAQVHPQLFTRKLLSTATERYGVEVVIGKLKEVRVESGRVDSVVLEGGRVLETEKVVLAMGPWCGKFEMLSSIFRVYGTKAHSIVLEPEEPNAITPHALFLTYVPSHGGEALDPEVYPRPTGEVYLCGMSGQGQGQGQNQMMSLSFSSQMSREDEEMARSALSAFRAKEDEIEKRKMEVRDRVKAQLGRVEEETRRLAHIREELESMADPMRKEVSWVRKKIDSVNKELKPLGSTVQKKEKEYKEALDSFNEKNREKVQLITKLMEMGQLLGESEKLRLKKLEELSKSMETQ